MGQVELFQFFGGYGLSSFSPFCLKLETFFKMCGVPYQIKYTLNIKKSPKGKLPYIVHNGIRVSDSGLIVEYVKKTFDVDPDQHLSALDRAAALAFARLIEEHAYWVLVYSRWIDRQNDTVIKNVYLGDVPRILKSSILAFLRRRIRRDLSGQGLGRHSESELYQLGCRDLSALSDFLGDKPYFFGDQVSSLDAVAHAFLANLMFLPFESPIKQHALNHPNLEAFCERIQNRYHAEC